MKSLKPTSRENTGCKIKQTVEFKLCSRHMTEITSYGTHRA